VSSAGLDFTRDGASHRPGALSEQDLDGLEAALVGQPSGARASASSA
jgi:hypothetical protein